MPSPPSDMIFAAGAFVLGACIGSFLNVCIYRLPLGLSVNEPRRSFCPACKGHIPCWHNIPVVSWVLLRGRCAQCAAPISFRYFGVELLTALLFWAIWMKVWVWGAPGWTEQAWVLAFPYWIMAALLVIATFIDFEHFIIPDEITIGGTIAGVVLSFAIPLLHGQENHLLGGVWSVIGAAAGFGALWLVVQLGKAAFGKKRLSFAKPEPLTWTRRGEEADLHIGGEHMLWSDFFYRGNERVLMQCAWLEIDGERFENALVICECDWLHLGEKKWELVKVNAMRGEVTQVTLPREAMGFGDVKFIAAIGAFLGWKAVVFTIMSASTFGALIGLLTLAVGRREWSTKLPFGPYLALGALLWLFAGPELIRLYWNYAFPPLG